MISEASGGGLVLAVHVVGDRASDRHPRAAGTCGREKAARKEHADELAHGDPGLADELAARAVECEQAVQPAGQHGGPAADEGAVAVAASATVREQTPGGCVAHRRQQLLLALRTHRRHGDAARSAEAAAA